jgi:hypothetical protein
MRPTEVAGQRMTGSQKVRSSILLASATNGKSVEVSMISADFALLVHDAVR